MKQNNESLRESKLVEAAKKAHVLTVEFRKLGVEAYEFHDRCESYVCIGSFDWVAREDSGSANSESRSCRNDQEVSRQSAKPSQPAAGISALRFAIFGEKENHV